MGQALIQGLLAHGVRRAAVRAADPDAAQRDAVRRRFHLQVSADNVRTAHASNIVILAVKPQQFPDVVAHLAPHLQRTQLVVSIAAGITLRWLEARLPGVPVVRVMPNLPATVGCGFAAMASGRRATAAHRRVVRAICEAVGDVVELPERRFDAVTAVSGSGPAYVFFLVQAWEAAARALGLPRATAARAIRSTLAGSARLLEASADPAAVLVSRVASKKGTTEAALRVLAKRRVAATIVEALRAAARRSRELSR
jgi:pyrroline-5-carboxylate reductase